MRVPVINHDVLEQFIEEVQEMVEAYEPFLLALKEDPERREIEKKVAEVYYQLWHSIKGTGSFLGLKHLVYLAEYYEYMLDQVLSGVVTLYFDQILLLEKGTDFLKNNFNSIWQNKSDDALAQEVDKLVNMIIGEATGEKADNGFKQEIDGRNFIQSEMFETFLGETRELLLVAEQEFVLWDYVSIDHARIQDLSTVINRLKCNFVLFELHEFERLSLVIESTLNRFLAGEVFQGEYPERVFIQSIDAMTGVLQDFSVSGQYDAINIDKYLTSLQGLIRQPVGELLIKAGLVAPEAIEQALEIQREKKSDRPRRLGEVLVEMGEVTNDEVDKALNVQHRQRKHVEKAWNEIVPLKDQLIKVEEERPLPDKVEVDMKTIQQILKFVQNLTDSYGVSEIPKSIVQLEQLCQPLQIISIETLVVRIKRFVHDLVVERKETVSFSVLGADSEINYGIIKSLYLSIIHLIYNAFEHGLETVDERSMIGKPKRSRLRLWFLVKGNELLVSVEDDGRGIDIKKVLRQAVERNIIYANKTQELTNQELTELIFELSAQNINTDQETSTRGLSVVRKQLETLGGRAEIISRPQKGTRVTMRIPL